MPMIDTLIAGWLRSASQMMSDAAELRLGRRSVGRIVGGALIDESASDAADKESRAGRLMTLVMKARRAQ
jgi:hypothetical protein